MTRQLDTLRRALLVEDDDVEPLRTLAQRRASMLSPSPRASASSIWVNT